MQDFHPKSRDEIASAYDSPAWWYDIRGFFILTFAYNSTLWEQLRLFGPNFGPRHIEIACGSGRLLDLFLRWRRWRKLPTVQVVGIDYAEAMLAGAVHLFEGNKLIDLRHADAAHLPFEDQIFDTANIANAFHSFPEVDSVLREVYRVLKSEGTVAANVLLYPEGVAPLRWIANLINRWGVRKGILVTPYTRADARKRFLEAGFVIVKEYVSGNCLNVLLKKR